MSRQRPSMITVASLEDARNVSVGIERVVVRRNGDRPITLLRRTMGNEVQGLYETGCRIDPSVKLPQTAVLVNGTVIEGDIAIGEGAILDNCRITGAGRIRPFTLLRNHDLAGTGKDVELPMGELRL